MLTMNYRSIAVFLLGFFVMLLLTSSGSSPALAQNNADETITISYMWWGGNPNNYYQVAKERFEAENPHIRVNLIEADKDKIVVGIASGVVDVMVVDAPWYAEFLLNGLLMPVSSLVEKDPELMRDLKEDFWPGSYQWLEHNGSLYGLPYSWTQTQVLFYNKRKFDEAGLPYPAPETWDELVPLMKKLTDGEGQYGLTPLRDWYQVYYWLLLNGTTGYFDDPIYPRSSNLIDPDTLQAAETLVNLHITDQVMGGSFESGTAAMKMDWWGIIGTWDEMPFVNDIDIVTVPAVADKNGVIRYPAALNTFAIAANSKHPQEALEWVKFLLSPEMMELATSAGAGIPTRRSVALAPEWLQAGGYQNRAALDPLTHAIPQSSLTPAWDEIRALGTPELAAAFEGEKSITTVFNALHDPVEALLRKYLD